MVLYYATAVYPDAPALQGKLLNESSQAPDGLFN